MHKQLRLCLIHQKYLWVGSSRQLVLGVIMRIFPYMGSSCPGVTEKIILLRWAPITKLPPSVALTL